MSSPLKPDEPNLNTRMAKGAAWTVAMRVSTRVIGFVSTIILARLLMPEDFGLVALASLFANAVELLGRVNFNVWLIRNPRAMPAHYDTVWTLNLLRAGLMAGLIAALAAVGAAFFDEPRLEALLYAIALIAFMDGLQSSGVLDFQKELTFDRDFLLMFWPKVGATTAAIVSAFVLRDYRALVVGMVVSALLRLFAGYAMHPYRPRLGLADWLDAFHYSKWLLINNILGFFYGRADVLVLGKVKGVTATGIYTLAFEISNMVTSELLAPMRRALLPGFAKLGEDREQLRRAALNVLGLSAALGLPVSIGLAVTAELAVSVLLGPRWEATVPLVRILCLYGIANVLLINFGPVMHAVGKPRRITTNFALGAGSGVLLLLFLVPNYGAVGAAWAVTAASVVVLFQGTAATLQELDLPLRAALERVWRSVVAGGVMAALVVGLEFELGPARSVVAGALQLALEVLVGVASYSAAHYSLWKLSESPDGSEKVILDFVARQLRRDK